MKATAPEPTLADLKPNLPHEWAITVYGPPAPTAPEHKTEWITGDIEDALHAADELESEVEFEVHQFVITRRAPVVATAVSAVPSGKGGAS